MKAPIFVFAALISAPALAGAAMQVNKTQWCGCCGAWVERMEAAGYAVEARNLEQSALDRVKTDAGLKPEQTSCHTAFVEDYLIEGHVPAQDIARLLKERPDAIGLAVPGMPIGSPGMEMGDRRDPYDVLLIGNDGGATVWRRVE